MKKKQKHRRRSTEHKRAQAVQPVAGFHVHAGELCDHPEEAVVRMRKHRRACADGNDNNGFFNWTDKSQCVHHRHHDGGSGDERHRR